MVGADIWMVCRPQMYQSLQKVIPLVVMDDWCLCVLKHLSLFRSDNVKRLFMNYFSHRMFSTQFLHRIVQCYELFVTMKQGSFNLRVMIKDMPKAHLNNAFISLLEHSQHTTMVKQTLSEGSYIISLDSKLINFNPHALGVIVRRHKI